MERPADGHGGFSLFCCNCPEILFPPVINVQPQDCIFKAKTLVCLQSVPRLFFIFRETELLQPQEQALQIFFFKGSTVIDHRKIPAGLILKGSDPDLPRREYLLLRLLETMMEAILNERLEDQLGNRNPAQGIIQFPFILQIFFISHFHDIQIASGIGDLLFQAHALPDIGQRVAEQIRQLTAHIRDLCIAAA